MILRIIALFSIFSVGCSDSADFASGRVGTIDQKDESDAIVAQVETSPETTMIDGEIEQKPTDTKFKVGSNSAFLTASTSKNNKKKDEPVEIVFLLDNSRSMTDNLTKLRDASGDLFAGLNTSALPYRARILTLDKIDSVIRTVPMSMAKSAPADLFSGEKPKYDREEADEEHYLSVEPFGNNREVDDIMEAINDSIVGAKSFQNEPGICAAMDYINWTTFTTNPAAIPFKDGQKIHIVSISDEENVRKIETTDRFSGEVTDSSDLVCYQENKTTQNCTKVDVPKKYMEASWTGYGFDITHPAKKQYSYTFKYQPRSTCQARGAVAYPDGTDELVHLYGLRRCHKRILTCNDTTRPDTDYACDAGNFSETKETNFQTENKSRCEKATKFSCEMLVDGVKVPTIVSRDVAYAEVINKPERGLTCTALYTDSIWEDIVNGADDAANGLRNCSAYTCQALPTTYGSVTIDLKREQDDTTGRFFNCRNERDYWYHNRDNNGESKYYKFLPLRSGSKINGLRQRDCTNVPNQPNLAEVSDIPTLPNGDLLYSGKFCKKNIEALGLNLSAIGVAMRNAVTNGPQAVADYSAGPYDSPRTKEQVAQALGIPTSHVTYFTNWNESIDNGTISYTNEYYSVDKFNSLESDYGTGNVARITDPNDANIGPKTVILGSGMEDTVYPWNKDQKLAQNLWNATYGVTLTEKEHPTETMTVDVCDDPVVAKKEYAPTPENFVQLMGELHKKSSITWHSIANLDGQSCPDAEEAVVSKGSDYLELAKLTKGLIADICDPDFKKFIELLTILVVDEVDLVYAIPPEVKGKIEKVMNKTQKKELKYEQIDKEIKFEKGSLEAGDEIEIIYDKHQKLD